MPHLPPNAPQLSVVIPLLDEAESLPELVAWIEAVMQKHQFTYEIVLASNYRFGPKKHSGSGYQI
jgi:hypothetical protein